MLANLLANAVKYVPDTTGEIVVSGRRAGDHVRICVRDNGVGIAPEYHEGIFKLFGRVPDADQAADGTGVGLAIVRGLIGSIRDGCGSSPLPGAGSAFHVELPAGPPWPVPSTRSGPPPRPAPPESHREPEVDDVAPPIVIFQGFSRRHGSKMGHFPPELSPAGANSSCDHGSQNVGGAESTGNSGNKWEQASFSLGK